MLRAGAGAGAGTDGAPGGVARGAARGRGRGRGGVPVLRALRGVFRAGGPGGAPGGGARLRGPRRVPGARLLGALGGGRARRAPPGGALGGLPGLVGGGTSGKSSRGSGRPRRWTRSSRRGLRGAPSQGAGSRRWAWSRSMEGGTGRTRARANLISTSTSGGCWRAYPASGPRASGPRAWASSCMGSRSGWSTGGRRGEGERRRTRRRAPGRGRGVGGATCRGRRPPPRVTPGRVRQGRVLGGRESNRYRKANFWRGPSRGNTRRTCCSLLWSCRTGGGSARRRRRLRADARARHVCMRRQRARDGRGLGGVATKQCTCIHSTCGPLNLRLKWPRSVFTAERSPSRRTPAPYPLAT